MRFLRLLLPLLVLALGASACKSDLGQRCQTDDDCDEGRCSADGICRLDISSEFEADAAPADGRIDGALDDPSYDARPSFDAQRFIDARPPSDATPVDAEPSDV
jgi:hypothetical protein